MCLVTSQREPYIAPIDIQVVKVLKVNKSIEFSTVFRNVSVSLNAALRAQGSWVNDFDKDRITQRLGKGLITHIHTVVLHHTMVIQQSRLISVTSVRIYHVEQSSLYQMITRPQVRRNYIS